jgi:hypothetical protein
LAIHFFSSGVSKYKTFTSSLTVKFCSTLKRETGLC